MIRLCIFCYGLFFIIGSQNVLGQDEKKNVSHNQTHFITGIGGSYVNVLDEGISPLLYNGIGGGVILGYFQEKENNINTSWAKFDFNNPSSSISNAEMYTFRLEGKYQHYWKIGSQKDKKLILLPGMDFSAKWALRQHLGFTNNSQHIETRFSFAPSLMIAFPFEIWQRKFELGAFNSIPLITYATRPLFASTRFSGSVNQEEVDFFDYLQGGQIISLGSYFKWSSQYYLYFPLKNRNGLRLEYFWNYESYRALNPIKTGEHSIMISTFFKI